MSVTDPDAKDARSPKRRSARPDSDWPRAILAISAMLVGALGFFGALDLLAAKYGKLPDAALIYFLFFFFLPAATINGSRFDTWSRAAFVSALALLTVVVSGTAVAYGAVASAGMHLPSIAGIVTAWLIAGGTIELSSQRWSRADSPPNLSPSPKFPKTRRDWGRIAIFFAVMTGFTLIGFATTNAQALCACRAFVGAYVGFGPALLIASHRTGGWKAWFVTIFGSLLSFVTVSAAIIFGSWAYHAWDLAGSYTTGMVVLFGPLIPGLIVTWLFFTRNHNSPPIMADSRERDD